MVRAMRKDVSSRVSRVSRIGTCWCQQPLIAAGVQVVQGVMVIEQVWMDVDVDAGLGDRLRGIFHFRGMQCICLFRVATSYRVTFEGDKGILRVVL